MNDDPEAARRLEQYYSRRGLKFTRWAEMGDSVQAFGWIDGKRFHFRMSGRAARLTVGRYDRDLELQHAAEQTEKYRNINGTGLVIRAPGPNSPELLPSVIEFSSTVEISGISEKFPPGLTGTAGVFAVLVESLTPVKKPGE